MAIPGLFFVYFRLFKQTLQFLQQINVKNVHPIYGARIRTHDLQYTSRLPQPGFPPRVDTFDGNTFKIDFAKNVAIFLLDTEKSDARHNVK